MKATSGNISTDHTNTGVDLFAIRVNWRGCELEASPEVIGLNALHELDRVDRVCYSSILLNQQMLQESERRKSIPDTDSSIVEVSAMVPGTLEVVDRLFCGPTNKSRNTGRPLQ